MPPDTQSTSTASRPASLVRILLGQPSLPAAHHPVYAPPRPPATTQPGWPLTEGTHAEADWVEAELETVAANADPAPREDSMLQAVQAPAAAPPQAGSAPRQDAATPLHHASAQPVVHPGPQPAPSTSPQTLPIMRSATEAPPPPSNRAQEQAGAARSALRPSVVPAEEQPAAVESTTIDIPGRAAARPEEERPVKQPRLPAPALEPAPPMPHAEATMRPTPRITTVQVPVAPQPTPPQQTVHPETHAAVADRGQARTPEPPIAEPPAPQPQPPAPPTRVRQGVDQTRPTRTILQPGPGTPPPVEMVRTERGGQDAATPLSQRTGLEPAQLLARQTESPAPPPPASEPVPAQQHPEAKPLPAQPGADSGRVLFNRQPLPTIQPPAWANQPSLNREAGQRESVVVQELRKKVDELAVTVASYEKNRQQQAEAPPPHSVVILNRIAPPAPGTHAFWARRYRSRAHLRPVR